MTADSLGLIEHVSLFCPTGWWNFARTCSLLTAFPNDAQTTFLKFKFGFHGNHMGKPSFCHCSLMSCGWLHMSCDVENIKVYDRQTRYHAICSLEMKFQVGQKMISTCTHIMISWYHIVLQVSMLTHNSTLIRPWVDSHCYTIKYNGSLNKNKFQIMTPLQYTKLSTDHQGCFQFPIEEIPINKYDHTYNWTHPIQTMKYLLSSQNLIICDFLCPPDKQLELH